MQYDLMKDMIENSGFEVQAGFDPHKLVARPEVRDMCAADKCHAYGTNWACPPGCGDIEYSNELFKLYSQGIVFQTVAYMEDEFDFETTMGAAIEHHDRFNELVKQVRDAGINKDEVLLVGVGSCSICKECTYPDKPCRFPDKIFPSMEAIGLLVGEVCGMAGIPYYHGPGTLAYVSCVLF
ncbi:MAG: DUF2284 domain-containing protein [Coriobacteriales bacterium]|jgi:predicted metal-binding protein|nr:DUF2284 domain-containing protein [Coriobacteriales bacterium]